MQSSEATAPTQVTKRPKTRVRFCDDATLHRVSRIDDPELWYSNNEYNEIRQKDIDLAQMVEFGILNDQNTKTSSLICLRGLEGRTHSGATKKALKRYRTYSAVLDEQYEQIYNPIPSALVSDRPETLRAVYIEHSRLHQEEAHALAIKDAEWVRDHVSTIDMVVSDVMKVHGLHDLESKRSIRSSSLRVDLRSSQRKGLAAMAHLFKRRLTGAP